MNKPLHVSVTWESISELFVQVAETALWPLSGFPKREEEVDRTNLYIALGAVVSAGAAFVAIWRRVGWGY